MDKSVLPLSHWMRHLLFVVPPALFLPLGKSMGNTHTVFLLHSPLQIFHGPDQGSGFEKI